RDALARLADARRDGFDTLLTEHRRAWAARWDAADVQLDGDDHLQLAIRVALYHLMGSVTDRDEAAVGARGLSGHAYRGHVFWDADVFVLPFLAATHPAAARAMLEYRVRRLPVALAAARAEGWRGARFPWESAHSGEDVTPRSVRDQTGALVPIRTGDAEVHIVADVAWAACCYADWSGDAGFAVGAGHRILVETARYWASRVRVDSDGTSHLYGVIGPDEYHEPVDDNMFTNVMARWNLRAAAGSALEHGGVDVDERTRWLELAETLVDGYDPETGIYEQCAGFFRLEPILIAEVAPRRPVAADLLVGRDRVRGAQVIKQADVLMAHHLVPDELRPGSLLPNIDYYEPRTAHGSSLSPGVHAAVLARAGRLADAVEWLRVAADVDLADVTATTAGGLHVATMGSVWQALAYGFAGLRARPDGLTVEPCLPEGWDALDVRVRFRDVPVRVRITSEGTTVTCDRPTRLLIGAEARECGPEGITVANVR
ncbi:MAG: glycosyl hydrolase family 65 protein, partial [Acidimicrobiia bacterium]